MRKLILAILLTLGLTAPMQAKPWYKDWKVLTVIGVSLAADAVATHEIHECRLREGVAFCDGGYGEFAAREVVRAVSTAGEDAIALGMRHDGQAFKYWAPVALGLPAYNTYVAYDETLKGCPTGYWPLWGTKFTCTNGWGTVKGNARVAPEQIPVVISKH